MKKVLLLLGLLWAVSAQAATQYVSQSGGNNGNSCFAGIGSPRQTIASGMSCIGSGDVLIIRGGTGGSCTTYTEGGFLPPSGSTIQAMNAGTSNVECVRIRPNNSGVDYLFGFTSGTHDVTLDSLHMDGGDTTGSFGHANQRSGNIIDGSQGNVNNITVRNSELTRTRHSCVLSSGDNWQFINNEVHHCGKFCCDSGRDTALHHVCSATGEVSSGDDHGLYIGWTNSRIAKNYFHHNPAYNMQFRGGNDSTIVEDNISSNSRCGDIFSGSNHLVRNNVWFDTGKNTENDDESGSGCGTNSDSQPASDMGPLLFGGNTHFINNTVYQQTVNKGDTNSGTNGSGEIRNIIRCGAGNIVGDGAFTETTNLTGTCPGFVSTTVGNPGFFRLSSDNTSGVTNSLAPIDAAGKTRRSPNSSPGAYDFGTAATGPPTKLNFLQPPSNVQVNASISPAVTVEVLDASNQRVTSGTGSTATISMALGAGSPAGTLSGSSPVAAVNGVATFPSLAINQAGTGFTLAASSSGLTGQTSSAFNVTLAPVLTPGPLIVHPSNGRYFQDPATGKAVFLAGSHAWCTFQNYNSPEAGPDVCTISDFPGFLAWLQARGHNFTKFWGWQELTADIIPYQRSGPGTALDGQPKVNLQSVNQAYFDRLAARVSAAKNAGIYVNVMLFAIPNYYSTYWKFDWYNPANNTQGIGPDCTDTNLENCALFDYPGNSTLLAIQEAYIKKVIDTVNAYDNVLYEIGNELAHRSLPWQQHMVDVIRAYEGTGTNLKRHLVGITIPNDSTMTELFATNADWLSPGGLGGYPDYCDTPPAATGQKVVIMDTDHMGNNSSFTECPLSSASPNALWKNVTQGQHFLIMETDNGPAFLTNTPYEPVRRNAGQAVTYLNSLPLAGMVPHGELASTGYALAQPGGAYVAYQPGSGPFSLQLQAATYTVKWWDVTARAETAGSPITAGGTQTFTPPFSGPAVLVLNTPAVTPTNALIAWWKLDEGSTLTAADSATPGGHTGTLSGSAVPVWVAGNVGPFALQFSGQNWVDVSGSFTDQSYSWAMWVRGQTAPDTSDQNTALANGVQADNTWSFGWSSSTAKFRQAASHRDGTGAYVTAQIPDALLANTWYHIGATYDGAALKIYLNGTLKATTPVTSLLAPSGNFRLGNDKSGHFGFQGALDDVRIYNYPITQQQMAALAGSGQQVVTKPRVRHQVVLQ